MINNTLANLLFAVLGIYASYMLYGYYQEKIYSTKYGDDAPLFAFGLFLVFVQCAINCAWAGLLLLVNPSPKHETPHVTFMGASFTYLFAMLSSNSALEYVSYPTQALAKSCKIVPVMLMGVLIHRKKYAAREYLCVLLITIGIAMFNLAKSKDTQTVSHPFGLLLLFISLVLDGLTGPQQDGIIARYKPTTHQLMFNTNLWATLFALIGLLVVGEFPQALAFCTKYPAVLYDILLFAACSAVGQNFIFFCVRHFGALVCAVVTTTRKFFTVLGSVFIFNHPLSTQQWLGVGLVFAGLTWDMFAKSNNKKHKK